MSKSIQDGTLAKTNTSKELIAGFLQRNYDPLQRALDLSGWKNDERLSQGGVKEIDGIKVVHAMLVVAEEHFEKRETKKDAIHSIVLTAEDLKDKDIIRALGELFPDVTAIYLSDIPMNAGPTHFDLAPLLRRLRALRSINGVSVNNLRTTRTVTMSTVQN